jgi:hypothetical protein
MAHGSAMQTVDRRPAWLQHRSALDFKGSEPLFTVMDANQNQHNARSAAFFKSPPQDKYEWVKTLQTPKMS